jgi:hypothetical protein
MSLILANSYNENDSTTIRDYSTNLTDSTGANMSMVADTFGYYADFNGTTSEYTTPVITGGNEISYYFEFYADSVTGTQYITNRVNNSSIYLSSNNLTFLVWDGASSVSVTFRGVSTGQWYKICCTYSSNTATIYVDDNSVEDSKGGGPATISDANVMTLGYDGSTSYFNGRLREFRIYDSALSSDNIAALISSQQGIQVNVTGHSFNVGDLVIQSDKNNNKSKAVVFASEADNVRVLPMGTLPIFGGTALMRCGHRWDTDRQYYFVLDGSTSSPEISVFDGVTLHSDLDSDTQKKILVNKDGIYKYSITKTADYTVTNKDLRLYVDSSGGAFTLTLPSSPTTNKELEIIDSVGSCSTYNVTIDGNGNNIIGSTTIVMSTDNEGFHLVWNGTQWNLT